MKRTLSSWSLNLALVVVAAITLAPLLWMVIASLMPAGEANTYPPRLWPSRVTFEHYIALFTRLSLARHLLNTAVIATLAAAISVVLNSMAGYAFAKLRFRGRGLVFQILLAALVIPPQVGMLPLFLMVKGLGIVNTWMAAVLPFMASVFGIFLIRQFAYAIPDDLLDAARMDGASEMRIYTTIVLPLLTPILLTLGVFVFLSAWNDFMWPLIVLSDEPKYTLTVALANLVGEHVQDTELMMAGSVLTVIPVLAVFVALQRYYMRGILMGGVKG